MKSSFTYLSSLETKPAFSNSSLLLVLLALFIPHLFIAFDAIENTIAPDLLIRTIGSRLQEAGKPFYQYQWQPGDPIRWLNPYPLTRVGLNGVVSTPFTLRLLRLLAKLDYCTIKYLWGWLQELLLFATVFICCKTFQHRFSQLAFIVVAGLFFVYDRNWLLNLYNGQMYILYAFVFAASGYLILKQKKRGVILFVLPVVAIIRPFFLTSIIPLFKVRKHLVISLVAGIVTAFMLIVFTTSASEWKQYNVAMQRYAKEQTNNLAFDTSSARLHFPQTDECVRNKTEHFQSFGAGCLYSVQHYLYLCSITLNDVRAYQVMLVLVLLLLWFFAQRMGWLQNSFKEVLLCFVFYQLCELLAPASRNPYNMIQWLPAVAWIIMSGDKKIVAIVVIGLCMNHDLPFRFKYEREIGELLLFAAVVCVLFKTNINTTRKKLNNHLS